MNILFASLLIFLSPGSYGPEAAPYIPVSEWQAVEGDQMLVDTRENIGYLIHPDGSWTSFIVATGQRRVVRYIGRVYNATTPEREWVVQEINYKGPSVTFGNGTFLRLYNQGESTPYGIHGHRYSAVMLARDERFASMGCVIVSDDILDLIKKTYEANGNYLNVTTAYGLEKLRVGTTPL